jgi:S1-C subfamily serine protease
MLRRSYLLVIVSLTVLFIIGACGGSSETEVTPAQLAPPISTQPPVAPVSATARPIRSAPTIAPPAPTAEPAPTPTLVPVAPVETPTPVPDSEPSEEPEEAEEVEEADEAEEAEEVEEADAPSNGEHPQADQTSVSTDQDLSTVEVVQILTPSVVQIVTETVTMGFANQTIPSRGVGTGVIIDEGGYILTNNHVIDGAVSITVTLNNGISAPAELVGGDFSTDLAIIRIEVEDLSAAQLGDSSELQVGEDVIAIGHALGLEGGPTVSKGVVSAIGRSIDTDNQTTIVDLIQTDASINPGNSGGPLVNNMAEVVGINTAIIEGSQGIGFSINIDDAKVVASQLIENGYVNRGFLGVTPVNLTPGIAEQLGLPITQGVILARVLSGTPAEIAGLKPEDVIVKLGDEDIANNGELSKFLIAHLPGETIDVVIVRGSAELTTSITLGERPR